jgi:hypothetical protein
MVDLRSRARPPGALHRELHKIALLAVETPRRLRLYSTLHVMIAWAANAAQRREIAQANVGFPADWDVHRRDPQRRLNVDTSRQLRANSGRSRKAWRRGKIDPVWTALRSQGSLSASAKPVGAAMCPDLFVRHIAPLVTRRSAYQNRTLVREAVESGRTAGGTSRLRTVIHSQCESPDQRSPR